MRPLLLVAFLSLGALAAETPPPAPPQTLAREPVSDFCRNAKCRSPAPGHPPVPYVREGIAAIYLGEEFAVTGDVKGGKLVNLRFVEGTPKGPVIRLKLETLDEGTLLTVKNGFPQHLKFDAEMQAGGTVRLQGTSTCPVIPGGASFEQWPHPVRLLLLENLRFLDESAPKTCE